jgi:putative DNA primase/helicase
MPDGEIISTPARPVYSAVAAPQVQRYAVQGTTESWRGSVARLAYGNYAMMTGVAAALAAPLIGLTGADGFAFTFL